MDRDTFVRVVQSFADKPCDVDDSRGILTAVLHGEIMEIAFQVHGGDLVCKENDVEWTPGRWISRRLARFETLAQRILDHLPADPRLISVEADFTDTLERNPNETLEVTANALAILGKAIEEKPAGLTHVVYLTADAGEGKTCLIEALARKQAERYLAKEDVRLVLPISLGGQALIRLDDIIVGSLTNRLRFPYYYIESVLELAKLDLLVIALDGFEEMFIETQAGGVSSLGTLVGNLGSSGRVICSARTAYYHYTNLDAQARLQDCLRGTRVSFSEIHLRRWNEPQFIACGKVSALNDEEVRKVYKTISAALQPTHPLLTRAVLARRLLEEYVRVSDQDGFLELLKGATGEEYFEKFVSALLMREANEKWLGRESPARPLLTVDQHHTLLMRLAEEMWHNGVEALAKETIRLTVELVGQVELGLPPDIVRQVIERAPQHPLLHQVTGTNLFRFDHEDFRSFYVGRLTGIALCDSKYGLNVLRNVLDGGQLPALSVRVAVAKARGLGVPEDWAASLSRLAEVGSKASYLRENVGRLAVTLLSALGEERTLAFHHLLVTGDVMKGRTVKNVRFDECVFESPDFSETSLENVVFAKCEMPSLRVSEGGSCRYSVEMSDTELPTKLTLLVHNGDETKELYAPYEIANKLRRLGFRWPIQAELPFETKSVEEDEEIGLAFRLFRAFMKTTAINEAILQVRFGSQWTTFERTVLGELLDRGILVDAGYRGKGVQRRFQLHARLDRAEKARSQCKGKFPVFLDLLVGTDGA